jgi:hypothetical protein
MAWQTLANQAQPITQSSSSAQAAPDPALSRTRPEGAKAQGGSQKAGEASWGGLGRKAMVTGESKVFSWRCTLIKAGTLVTCVSHLSRRWLETRNRKAAWTKYTENILKFCQNKGTCAPG